MAAAAAATPAERARGREPACAAAPAAAAARAATVPVAREPTVARREGIIVAAVMGSETFLCVRAGVGVGLGLGRVVRTGMERAYITACGRIAAGLPLVKGCVVPGLRNSPRRLT
jgi:hypothetical protein